jgi:hypothetical protein
MDGVKCDAQNHVTGKPAIVGNNSSGPAKHWQKPQYRDILADVLIYIFTLNATHPDALARDRARTTIACSQVCARWRLIALGYPVIWSPVIDYNYHSLKLIEEMLNRSAPSLFDFGSRVRAIDLTCRDGRGLSVLELVFNHAARLRVFHLQAPTAHWERVCSCFFQQPAPNLEFVQFCILFDAGRMLEGPLFNNHAPKLQKFLLRRCAVNFTSPILTPLTELYVHEITALNAAPGVLSWLRLLLEMPSLQWITIIDAISDVIPETILPVVDLDGLKMLSVDGPFDASVTLVSQLIIPTRCGLRLRCDRAQFGLYQRRLWGIVEQKIGCWEMGGTYRRRLDAIHREKSITIGMEPNIECVWDTEAQAQYFQRPQPPDPVLALQLRNISNPEDTTSLFLSLMNLFERAFGTTIFLRLWIDFRAQNGTEVFTPLVTNFRSLINLESLYLVYDSHSFLFPILQSISLPDLVLLPALHTLLFVNADFRPTSDSLASVATFLTWRKAQGLPIQNIDIIESWIDRKHIRSLLVDVSVDLEWCNDSDSESDEYGNT